MSVFGATIDGGFSSAKHEGFKTVNLSGPINTLLPMNETKNIEATIDEQSANRVSPSPFCPYARGNEIHLKTYDGIPIKALVVGCFQTTLSCVMVIRFVEPSVFNNTSECIMKLFDRRFSTQAREDLELSPWSPSLEERYQEFVRNGDADELFGYWEAEKQLNSEWSAFCITNCRKWSPAKWEAYIQWQSNDMHEVEKRAYQLMAVIQGTVVPKMLSEVVLDLSRDDENSSVGNPSELAECVSSETTEDGPDVNSISGLLLQYVEGFGLIDLHEHLPREYWQATVDSSLATLQQVQECGILNYDVSPRSFIIDPVTLKATMIDFGITKFREDAANDKEWEEMQAHKDEGYLVAMGMQSRLKILTGSTITYKPTERQFRLRYRYRNLDEKTGIWSEKEGGTKEEDNYVQEHKDFVYEA